MLADKLLLRRDLPQAGWGCLSDAQDAIMESFTSSWTTKKMLETRGNPLTAIVDAVAFETQKNQFRGSVFGQRGMYINSQSLRQSSADLDLNEFVRQSEELHAYVVANGPVRF
jgi:hypothetical protein